MARHGCRLPSRRWFTNFFRPSLLRPGCQMCYMKSTAHAIDHLVCGPQPEHPEIGVMVVETMLMRTDPFRDLDRLTQQLRDSPGTLGSLGRPTAMPMGPWPYGGTSRVNVGLPAS